MRTVLKFPIGGSKSQKPPVMAVLCWGKKIFLNIEKGYGNDSKALIFIYLWSQEENGKEMVIIIYKTFD